MVNIDHYHGDEMRHMQLPQGPTFWYAASHVDAMRIIAQINSLNLTEFAALLCATWMCLQ